MQRSRFLSVSASAAITLAAAASLSSAQTFTAVQRDDVAFGLSRNNAVETTHLVRGHPVGTRTSNEWGVGFIQSVQFDNLDGFLHNSKGNLLGVNFGTQLGGGELYSMQTAAGMNPGASTKIFDFATYNAANPGNMLLVSRLGGVSASPDNTKVAMVGNDGGNVYVFDYAAGDGTGTGNQLTNGRQFAGAVAAGSTQGSAWLDNNNVLLTDNTGALKKLELSSGSITTVATLPQPVSASPFSSVTYDPTVSPNAYVMLAGLDAAVTINRLHIVNPGTGAIVRSLDYSVSMNTGREISFNSRGDLVSGVFGNTTSVPVGGSMELIANAVNAGSLADNTSTEYYIQATGLSAAFNGSDVATEQLDYVTPGVTVDVKKRTHVQQHFGASAPLAQLRVKILQGFAGGSWNGAGGILSSEAAATATIQDGVGYGDASTVPTLPTTGPSFVVRYTLLGDANLDLTVNINDFSLLGANFNQSSRFWPQGDFNYDGTANINDFSLLAANFNQTAPAASGARGVVPEPATAGLVTLAVGILAVSRRRQHSHQPRSGERS